MKKGIIFLVLFIFTSLAANSNNDSLSKALLEKETIRIETVLDENGRIVYRVVAAIATSMMPEFTWWICKFTNSDEAVCEAAYEAISALVKLKGKNIYSGITKGLKWLVKGDEYRRTVQISTKEYDIAVKIKEVFSAYRNECSWAKFNWMFINSPDEEIVWDETVSPDKRNNYGIIFGKFRDKRDRNQYTVFKYMGEIWFADNLKFKMKGAYANQKMGKEAQGLLYTLDAAEVACPNGWKLPSANDWKRLLKELGGHAQNSDELTNKRNPKGKKAFSIFTKLGIGQWAGYFSPKYGQSLVPVATGIKFHNWDRIFWTSSYVKRNYSGMTEKRSVLFRFNSAWKKVIREEQHQKNGYPCLCIKKKYRWWR